MFIGHWRSINGVDDLAVGYLGIDNLESMGSMIKIDAWGSMIWEDD